MVLVNTMCSGGLWYVIPVAFDASWVLVARSIRAVRRTMLRDFRCLAQACIFNYCGFIAS